jgi:quercetin dioxygenase-like cupin family protein
MAQIPTRRTFLRSAPLAAAAVALPFHVSAQTPASAAPVPYKLVPAAELNQAIIALHIKPGNFSFFDHLAFTAVLTYEEKHSAAEFEYHEGRDHILQILEGSTVYEIGGTPQTPHSKAAGEWLAPISTGAQTLTLHKGDILVIPRNTPHKRTTAAGVTFYLFSVNSPTKP